MKRVALRLVLVLAAVLAGVLALDVLVRALDLFGLSYYADVQRYLTEAIEPAPPEARTPGGRLFQNRPDVHLDLRRFDYRTDARGLRTGRGRELPPDDALPVLFLGDSVTLGWGVDDAESWVRILEREARAADGRRLRCMNAGHLVYDTTSEASLLEDWGPELAPEAVVLTFIFNDLQPTWEVATAMVEAPAAAAEDGFDWRGSLVGDVAPGLAALLLWRREVARVRDGDPSEVPPFSYYPSGWPRCAEALERVRATCAELGARLVVNDHTTPRIPELAAWCDERGVDRIDTALSPSERRRYRNSAVDAHLNAEGNRVLAARARSELRRLGLLAE